ncbi:MAG TPA: hypothetical protein VEW48_25695 [Thermoanaerobaculia bacterium]|nr:hypothetical protein [Thermoanaerobaculia bacterium]
MATSQKTDKEIDKDKQKILKELESFEREAKGKGLSFSRLTEEQIVKKLRGETANSPFITGQGWTSGTPPGTAASYSVSIFNPDPATYYPIFVSIFFGLFNFLPGEDIGESIAGYLPAWPYMSTQPFSLPNGASANKTFTYTTPSSAPKTTYTGNALLWLGNYHDMGTYYDRGLFDVTLI